MRNVLRSASILALFAAALSARAIDLQFSSNGSIVIDPSGNFEWSEQVRNQTSGGSLSQFFWYPGNAIVGDQPYIQGNSGDLWLHMTKLSTTAYGGGQFVDAGSWSIDPAKSTGAWHNMAGGGVWSTSRILSSTQNDGFYYSGTSWVGRYAPVPEPASLAALGLGALGVLRRRKRA